MGSETADRELVERLLAGDSSAFETFFDHAFPALYRFALSRLGDQDAAEDAAQATLCLAVRRLATWRGEASLITWLFTLARHEIWRLLQARRREPVDLIEDRPEMRALLESLSAEAAGTAGLETEVRRRELVRLVQTALDSLPGLYGEVLGWKYLEDLPVSVIADRLKIGPKAAESLLTRARGAFREGFTALAQELKP